MDISPIFFYLFAGISIFGASAVVLRRNPVTSAFHLILVLVSFAGLYAMLEAHLLAALQTFVYAGAIMVLFLFVIMLLNADTPSFDLHRMSFPVRMVSGAVCAGLFGIFVWAFQTSEVDTALLSDLGVFTSDRIDASGGNTQVLSELLFSEYLLPFELTSLLLLSAIIGAVALAKRQLRRS